MYELLLATEAETTETTEHAEEASGLDIILPAPAELVYGAISFLIVFWVLAKFAFPRLNEMLEERKKAIVGKMEEADKALADAEASKASFEARIADARGEASRIVEDAKQAAEAMRRDIVAKAEAEAQAIVSRANAAADAQRDQLLQELRGQVGAISIELASKIVEKELDAGTHAALVDEYIARLSRSN